MPIPPIFGAIGARTTAVGGAFSPTNKAAALTLSNLDRTATKNGVDSFGVVLGTASLSGGRIWKMTVNAGAIDGFGIGLANTSINLTNYLGSDGNGVGYLTDGTVRKSGSNLASGLDTWGATNDVVFLETSADLTQVRFKKGAGGTWSSWITHGLAGTLYVACYLFYATRQVTGDFT